MIRTSPQFHRVTCFTTLTRLLLLILLSCTWILESQAQSDDTKIVNSDRAAVDVFGTSVDISGDYAIVGAPYEDENASGENTLPSAGSVYIYKKDASGEWQQLKKIVASDRKSPDEFGWSAAISGDLAIVGARLKYEDNETIGESGAAYIFQKDQGGTDNWGEVTKIIPADREQMDYFGISVDISDEYAIVGAYQEDEDGAGLNTLNNPGSAYIFKKDEGGTNNWGELTKIVPADRDAEDEFGYTVAISGDYVVVGARQDEHDVVGANPLSLAGSAYLFQKDQGGTDNWGEVKKLVASDRSAGQDFGWSVSASGDNILIGTNGRGAYLFNKDEGGIDNWGETQKLLPDDFAGNGFGSAVSISGGYVLIGASAEDRDKNGENALDNAGAAYLFVNTAGTWQEIQKFVSSDRASGDHFGRSVAITSSGESIVGAPNEDEDVAGLNTLDRAGAAYLFPSKTVQTITFEALPSKTYGDAAFVVTATSSSGLPIEFSTANPSTGEQQGEGPDPIVTNISGNTITIVSAGTIDIIASQAGNETYWSAGKTQNLVVNKVTLTVTADDQSRDYRAADPAFTLSYSGFIEGEDESDLDFLPEIEVDAHNESSVGEYLIFANGGFDNNYEFSYVDGTLTINKIPVTITADSYTIVYGEYPPEDLTYTHSELADEGDLSGDPDITTEAGANSDVGTYPITIGGVTDENYEITFVNGTLTITRAALVAVADDMTINYGDVPEYTFSYTGFVNGEDESAFETAPMASVGGELSSVGTYPILVSEGTIQNYSVTYEEGTLTVDPASLVLTADDQTITYSDPSPDFTVSYAGFVNGEDESVLLTIPSTGTEGTVTDAGTYEIGISGGSAQNYTVTRETGTLTINPASLMVTAENKTKTYGEENPSLTLSYDGFVNEEDESDLEGSPLVSTEVDETSNVGAYPISVSGGSAPNYSISHVDGILAISQATLTATANDQVKTYGEANPNLTLSYDGFVNGEDESVLAETPVISTEADAFSNAGTYPIALSEVTDGNYIISRVDGTLSITQAALLATADDQLVNEGDELPAFTISYTGFVNEDDASDLDTPPITSTSVNDSSVPGTYDIIVSDGLDNNYTFNYTNGLLTISNKILGLSQEHAIEVYPNPVMDYLVVNSTTVESLEIYDLKGTRILSSSVKSKLNVSGLKEGIYLLKMKDSEGKLLSINRIIKR